MGLKMGILGPGGSGVPVPNLGGAGWILGGNPNPGTTTPSTLCTTKPHELQLPASPAARQSRNNSQHALPIKWELNYNSQHALLLNQRQV